MTVMTQQLINERLAELGREQADYDAWFTPTMRVPVPKLGVLDTRDINKISQHGPEMVSFTQIFNITGLPAASIPAGFDKFGLPIGIQLAGRMGAGLITPCTSNISSLKSSRRMATV